MCLFVCLFVKWEEEEEEEEEDEDQWGILLSWCKLCKLEKKHASIWCSVV